MADSQPVLEPETEVACDACGETEAEEVASSAELAAQIELVRREGQTLRS
jgi:hypothetical protein